jgi:hypothetical protein
VTKCQHPVTRNEIDFEVFFVHNSCTQSSNPFTKSFINTKFRSITHFTLLETKGNANELTSNPTWVSIWRMKRTSRSTFDCCKMKPWMSLFPRNRRNSLKTCYLLLILWWLGWLLSCRSISWIGKLWQFVSYHCHCICIVGGVSRRRGRFSAWRVHRWCCL